jgi:DNA-3-methyladenine glycosylase II
MNEPASILIPVPPNFSFQECIWFLNRNYDDCLHVIGPNSIRKAIEFDGQVFVFEIQEKGNFLKINVLNGETRAGLIDFVIAYIREWFDMDRDIQPFYQLLETDENLDYMVDSFRGLRLIGIADLFEALCWSIIGQQINLTFAYKLKRRLVEKYGKSVELDGEVYHVFPLSQILSGAHCDDLRAMQFSQKKAEYLIELAGTFKDGRLSKQIISALPDFLSRQRALTAQRGIGVWTANYSLMKSLRESGGIPYGDVGLFNALVSHNVIVSRTETDRIDKFFASYKGWETYVVFYLWRSLAVK